LASLSASLTNKSCKRLGSCPKWSITLSNKTLLACWFFHGERLSYYRSTAQAFNLTLSPTIDFSNLTNHCCNFTYASFHPVQHCVAYCYQ